MRHFLPAPQTSNETNQNPAIVVVRDWEKEGSHYSNMERFVIRVIILSLSRSHSRLFFTLGSGRLKVWVIIGMLSYTRKHDCDSGCINVFLVWFGSLWVSIPLINLLFYLLRWNKRLEFFYDKPSKGLIYYFFFFSTPLFSCSHTRTRILYSKKVMDLGIWS